MDKHFICLANSYKHGGRCIAGVETEYDGKRWIIKRDNKGMPIWIRPISRTSPTEEINTALAENIHILEVVKLTDVVGNPCGAQTENVWFSSMTPTGRHFKQSIRVLDRMSSDIHEFLFYNTDKSVTPDYYQIKGDHSIILVKATDTIVYLDNSNMERPKYRVNFQYKGNVYDLPITDPLYLEALRSGAKTVGGKGKVYISCSLGIEHEGMHYKLAACVLEPEDNLMPSIDSDNENWFDEYAEEMQQLLVQKDEIELKIQLLRLKILQEMEKRKIEKTHTPHIQVSYIPSKPYMQFDREKFKNDYPDLYTQYLIEKQRESSIVVKRIHPESSSESDNL